MPRITFALFAYQQERFVREAVLGALQQDCEPMEIILSDDASADRTFEIMRELAASYRGLHRVVLNRMACNAGIAEHINHVMGMAGGDLIVGGAGDDVSAPERVRTLASAWEAQGRPSMLLSDFSMIDDAGTRIPGRTPRGTGLGLGGTRDEHLRRFATRWDLAVVGATAAWSRAIFAVFGPLPATGTFEDDVLAFRALLLEGIAMVPQQLVQYRQHAGNLTNRAWLGDRGPAAFHRRERELEAIARIRLATLRSHAADLAVATSVGRVAPPLSAELLARLERQAATEEKLGQWWSLPRAARLRWVLVHATRRDARVPSLRWGLPRLLPLALFVGLASLAGRVRGMLKRVAGSLRHE